MPSVNFIEIESEPTLDAVSASNFGRRSPGSGGQKIARRITHILFRCTLTPLVDMKIDNFPDLFGSKPRERSPRPRTGEGVTLVALPDFISEWTRRYRAVEYVRDDGGRRYWRASLEADGLINQISGYRQCFEYRFWRLSKLVCRGDFAGHDHGRMVSEMGRQT